MTEDDISLWAFRIAKQVKNKPVKEWRFFKDRAYEAIGVKHDNRIVVSFSVTTKLKDRGFICK